jgi:hypothetical protein
VLARLFVLVGMLNINRWARSCLINEKFGAIPRKSSGLVVRNSDIFQVFLNWPLVDGIT